MVFRSSGPMAWPLVWVLNGVLVGLPAASAQAEAVAVSVAGVALPPEAPPGLMLAKHWHAALNPGEFIDITVSAPCASNSLVPTTFYRGRTLSATASMMIEN